MSELPLFKFLEDKYLNIEDILSDKIPQKPLPVPLQTEIAQILTSCLPNICNFLDAVSTARTFLSAAGGDPNTPLLDYMKSLHLATDTVMGMSRLQLQISHVEALLKYLLLLRAKQMVLNGQCPFSQIIPPDYKTDLTESLRTDIRDFLVGVSHEAVLSTLFCFIWTQLRNPATGDDSERPNHKLKDYLSAFSDEDTDSCSSLPDSFLVKHSIAVFHCLVMIVKM